MSDEDDVRIAMAITRLAYGEITDEQAQRICSCARSHTPGVTCSSCGGRMVDEDALNAGLRGILGEEKLS